MTPLEIERRREREQELLLAVVETWRPSQYPEYRGFRCANCQHYKDQAWYHWVNAENRSVGYRLPVHLCDETCEPAFKSGNLAISQVKRAVIDPKVFSPTYPREALNRFREIVASWPDYREPQLKAFTCDDCGEQLAMEQLPDGTRQRQGYHVWWKMDDGKTFAELHFHRECGHKLGIYSQGV